MNKEEILAAYRFRHACKEFDKTKKISEENIGFILETARLSPSSFGFEPWHLLMVQTPELREKLKDGAWGATLKLDTASHFVVCLAMKSSLMRHDSDYLRTFMRDVQHLSPEWTEKKGGFFRNFQLSDFDLNDERSIFDWSAKQSYIALGNMMTAAAMIGIDSCPIEGFNQQTTDKILSETFGVDPAQYGVAWMAAFGYRRNEQGEKTRRPLSQIVSWK